MVSEPGSPVTSDHFDSENTKNELNPNRNSLMTKSDGFSKFDPHIVGSPLGLITSHEGPLVHVVTIKLNGENYRTWAQAMKLTIGGRGKIGYINCLSRIPKESELQETQRWHMDNSLVPLWLINAMIPKI